LPVVKPGDCLFVQGAHAFKIPKRSGRGPGQTAQGRRRANHVEVLFSFDRWEVTSGSAYDLWLRGRQRVASLLRVVRAERVKGTLRLQCTVFGIALAFDGLKTRDYEGVGPLLAEVTPDNDETRDQEPPF
jgi:hypothetical protein